MIIGEVYDDTRSLPVAGASVEAIDPLSGTLLTTVQTDTRGRYLLDLGEQELLIRTSKPGFTTVERTVDASQVSFTEVLDARLTPLAASVTVSERVGSPSM